MNLKNFLITSLTSSDLCSAGLPAKDGTGGAAFLSSSSLFVVDMLVIVRAFVFFARKMIKQRQCHVPFAQPSAGFFSSANDADFC